MISQTEIKKRNLESSLLFMQQEHANTLKALHEEISVLQKRCTELTFDLTMKDASNPETDVQEKENKIKELESLLIEQESKHKQLEVEIQTKDTAIEELKVQLQRNEKRFMEELKKKNKQVLALKVELDNKGSTIAYLTTEMHKLKVVHSSSERLEVVSPSPPSSSHGTRRKPRRITSASDIESRPVTAKGAMLRPDAEVFLTRTVAPVVSDIDQEAMAVKPTPPVLPPITGGDDATRKSHDRRQKLLRRRLDLKSQPEYTKLAVDKLNSNSNTWVHEPNVTK